MGCYAAFQRNVPIIGISDVVNDEFGAKVIEEGGGDRKCHEHGYFVHIVEHNSKLMLAEKVVTAEGVVHEMKWMKFGAVQLIKIKHCRTRRMSFC